ncbi:uncharacterized protein LOC130736714 [Lotus japonicus]|uniref:uncharacterized protein LOC130736714 n=1 Tax=Lotus japonicus TaxID=34305 RepID=UPI00258987DA|nr:uncharacterized protein LOC130736714 [Lotus japonicus]
MHVCSSPLLVLDMCCYAFCRMSFSVLVHHHGVFAREPHWHYKDVKITKVGVDKDRWGYFECLDTVKDLGYTRGKFKIWWRTRDDIIAHNFRPVLTDKDAMDLATFAIKNMGGSVHLFVEHTADELPSSPMELLRFLDGRTPHLAYAPTSTKSTSMPLKPPSKCAAAAAKATTSNKPFKLPSKAPSKPSPSLWAPSKLTPSSRPPSKATLSMSSTGKRPAPSKVASSAKKPATSKATPLFMAPSKAKATLSFMASSGKMPAPSKDVSHAKKPAPPKPTRRSYRIMCTVPKTKQKRLPVLLELSSDEEDQPEVQEEVLTQLDNDIAYDGEGEAENQDEIDADVEVEEVVPVLEPELQPQVQANVEVEGPEVEVPVNDVQEEVMNEGNNDVQEEVMNEGHNDVQEEVMNEENNENTLDGDPTSGSDDSELDVHFSDSEEERTQGIDDGFQSNTVGVAEALLNEQLRKMTDEDSNVHVVQNVDEEIGGFHGDHDMEAGWESEELNSMSEGDSDDSNEPDRRHLQFRPEDMRPEFKFRVGMEFTSL